MSGWFGGLCGVGECGGGCPGCCGESEAWILWVISDSCCSGVVFGSGVGSAAS